MSHQADSWAFSLKFFIPGLPPLLPGGLKFPSWSGTNLFSSSLQYFYFIVAKKTSLTDSPCQNASYVIPSDVQRADAVCAGKQAGRMEGFKDTKEMTDPWWWWDSWPLGLVLTTQKGCQSQGYTCTWQSGGDKVVNTMNSAWLVRLPPCRQLGAADPMENHLRGQLCFRPQKSNKEMDQRVTGIPRACQRAIA